MSLLASVDWGLLPGYTVIGITLGGIYALAAIGLVLIYRVSGVLNFAQGAVSMFSAFIAYQASIVMGYPAVNGVVSTGQGLTPLQLGSGTISPPTPTSDVQLTANLDAAAVEVVPVSVDDVSRVLNG